MITGVPGGDHHGPAVELNGPRFTAARLREIAKVVPRIGLGWCQQRRPPIGALGVKQTIQPLQGDRQGLMAKRLSRHQTHGDARQSKLVAHRSRLLKGR